MRVVVFCFFLLLLLLLRPLHPPFPPPPFPPLCSFCSTTTTTTAILLSEKEEMTARCPPPLSICDFVNDEFLHTKIQRAKYARGRVDIVAAVRPGSQAVVLLWVRDPAHTAFSSLLIPGGSI